MKKAILVCLVFVMIPTLMFAGDLKEMNGRGKALFKARCEVCHISKQEGDQFSAYTLRFNPPDFSNSEIRKNLNRREIQKVIKKGRGAMPPQTLEPDEVEAIIDYLVGNNPA